jgi:uncharacterized protein with HEPN domain
MQPDRDPTFLADMLRFAREVQQFTQEQTAETYLADLGLRRRIERSLELVAEASKRVSQSVKDSHPEIDWRGIVGQRNILAHDYGEVIDLRVWRTAHESIPTLIEQLESLFTPEPE